ncbi:MAG: integrase catalytic domain-containing protein, partial [Ardenticatenaceae bacterium]
RYLKASKSQKGLILDEFVVVTGMHRKSAIRLLRHGYARRRPGRGRPRIYTGDTIGELVKVWRMYSQLCGKRLAPFMAKGVKALERHGELVLDPHTKAQLLAMSASTIDRKLAHFRSGSPRGLATTKPGTLLRQAIPIRTFAEWDEAQPGFVEMDLVAHCGESAAGQYIQTLVATDIRTGWTECLPLAHRSQVEVSAAVERLAVRLPFPLRGIDSDNDGVFINETLLSHCQAHAITFTRCRPYHKNDQAHVEQKNWTIVRQTIGYQRYESPQALEWLASIYADLRLYVNFFQPVQKLLAKERNGSRVHKKYDLAKTPHQRAMAAPEVSGMAKLQLQQQYLQLNPAELKRRMQAHLRCLWALPR